MKKVEIEIKSYLDMIGREYNEKFSRFQELLLEYNQRFNLTSVMAEQEILYKHFLDSLAGESLFPQNANVVEIGSGAGFPSIPLKIAREDLSFTLIESTGKKCDFLRVAVKEMELQNVKICNIRAEEGGKDENFREKYDVSCARAVARLNTLAEYCMPFVKIGGQFIAYKGSAQEEITEAEHAIEILGGKVEKVLQFSLPEGMGERTLVVVRKLRATPQKYPRGRGKERSDPLL